MKFRKALPSGQAKIVREIIHELYTDHGPPDDATYGELYDYAKDMIHANEGRVDEHEIDNVLFNQFFSRCPDTLTPFS